MQWLANFLNNVQCNLVFYTDEGLVDGLRTMRGKLPGKFVTLPRDEWTGFKKYGRKFWEGQRNIDPEASIHSADLYAIWYEKKEFVRRAMELYPDCTKFIWCDAGAFRNEMITVRDLVHFGCSPYRILPGKMTLLQVFPFTSKEIASHAADGVGQFDGDRVGGGIQAGDREAWSKWSELYDEKMALMHEMSKFIGKDQTVMGAVVLSNPELVYTVQARSDIYDRWFTLLYHLAGPKVSILIPVYNGSEYLLSAVDSVIKQTFKQWEIIVGVNGHPAGSEVYQTAIKVSQEDSKMQRIRIMDMPDVHGKSAALNRMVSHSDHCSSWIALLDVDDLWHPEKLYRQYSMLNQANPDIIGTQCKYFGEMHGSPNIPTGDISDFDFWTVNPILNSSCMIRKELAKWNEANDYLEDYELWLRLRYGPKRTGFYNIHAPLMYHRIHKESHFNSGLNADRLPEFLKAMRKELLV